MSDRVQKMARINVDREAWTALRVDALREDTTLADRIGTLIELEAERLRRADGGSNAASPPGQPIGGNSTSQGENGTVSAQTGADIAVPVEHDWSAYRVDRGADDTWVPPWEK